MTQRSVRPLLVALLLAAVAPLVAGAARADTAQAPLTTACPAAFDLRSVAYFEMRGPYKLPRLVDTAGNQDGLVCALQLPDGARDADCRAGGTIACLLAKLDLPLYHFVDDDNPASQNAQANT